MNKIINKFLLAGDKYMPKLYLRQKEFTNSASGKYTKHRERIQKSGETGNLKQLYRNELRKGYFAHDAAYSDSKYLTKRTVSDNILKNRVY